MRLALVLFLFFVVILPSFAQTDRANALLDEAHLLVQDRAYKDAIKKLKTAERIFKKRGKKTQRIQSLLQITQIYILDDDNYQAKKLANKILGYTSSKDTLAASALHLLGTAESKDSKYTVALDFHKKALAIQKEKLPEQHPNLAASYQAIGMVQNQLGQTGLAFDYLQKAFEINQSIFGEDHPTTAITMSSFGKIYSSKGNHQRAIELLQKSIDVLKKEIGEKNPSVVEAYFRLGEAYMAKGNYDLGLMNMQRGLTVFEEIKGSEHHPERAPFLNNIGKIYTLRGDYNQALEFYLQALEQVAVHKGLNHADAASSYNNIAEVLQNQGQLDSALFYYKESLKVNERLFGDEHPEAAQNWSDIGTVYFKMGKYDQALAFYNNAFSKFEEFYGTRHLSIAQVEQNIGATFLKKGGYEMALEHFQNSLNSNLPFIFETEDITKTPPLGQVLDKNIFLSTLSLKAQALTKLYISKGNFKNLELAFENFILCDELIDDIRRTFIGYNDQFIFNQTASQVYEEAIYTCLILKNHTKEKKYISKAFYFSEKSKSNALLQSFANDEAMRFADLPDSLEAQEIVLKINISHAQKLLMNASQAKDSLKITSAQERLLESKEAYNQFVLQLEKDYPNYYELKYDKSVATLEQVQETLESGTTLIEFMSGEKQLFIFGITSNDAFIDIINKPTNYNNLISTFRKSVSDFKYITHSDSIIHTWNTYTSTAYELYEILLKEPLSHFSKRSFSKLIIIPDGTLGYIPFEILLYQESTSSTINYAKLDYLMQRYSISYAFSGSMLLNQSEGDFITRPLRYGGFAPAYSSGKLSFASEPNNYQYFKKGRYVDLPASRKGVEQIADLLEGNAFIEGMATESLFKDTSHHFDILHLAMHGVYDDINPLNSHLIFSQTGEGTEDNYLTSAELYNMNIDARMVFIGACNSGFGKINKGEGIMSLSRSFAYAGCPSIVMSLWSVPDDETATITNFFFQQIKNGASKDEALQKAKLQYLNDSNTPPNRQHPLYWAGFVPIGDMIPLYAPDKLSNNWTLLAAVSMLALTLFVGMLLWRRFVKT